MPEDIVTPPPAAAPAEIKPELWEDGTPFNPTRAKETIVSQREKIKAGDAAIKQLADLQKEKDVAEQARLVEQGNYQKIAADLQARLDESNGTLGSLSEYKIKADEILGKDIQSRIEKLPEKVRSLVPDEKTASPLDRMAKLAELELMQEALKPAALGNAPIKGAVSQDRDGQTKIARRHLL